MNEDQNKVMILIELEKNLVKNYATAITEASNDNLTQKICELFNMSLNASRDLFNLANEKGWYQLEYAQIQKIEQEYQKLSQKLSDIQGANNE
ncbi:MAG: spore coat protein [Bacilli bacterium]|nr:spore coat protein [Bacilli bacterium]